MLNITERAKDELHQTLKAYQTRPIECLRLTADDDDEFSLTVDVRRPGDTVVEHRGIMVLLVEAELAEGLDGALIDCTPSDDGPQLTISR